jgi:hypothetical protein
VNRAPRLPRCPSQGQDTYLAGRSWFKPSRKGIAMNAAHRQG